MTPLISIHLIPQSKAAHYAGRDVAVTGALDGGTIRIDFIEPNKVAANKKPESN